MARKKIKLATAVRAALSCYHWSEVYNLFIRMHMPDENDVYKFDVCPLKAAESFRWAGKGSFCNWTRKPEILFLVLPLREQRFIAPASFQVQGLGEQINQLFVQEVVQWEQEEKEKQERRDRWQESESDRAVDDYVI